MSISEIKEKRFLFMRALYEVTGGEPRKQTNAVEVANKLGMNITDENLQEIKPLAPIIDYLNDESLLKVVFRPNLFNTAPMRFPLNLAITHAGVVEVEEALAAPNSETKHFPSIINITNIENMNNSSVHQGNVYYGSTIIFNQGDNTKLEQLVDELKTEVATHRAEINENLKDVELYLSILESQVTTTNKNPSIIQATVETITTLCQGAAGSGLWDILKEISKLLP